MVYESVMDAQMDLGKEGQYRRSKQPLNGHAVTDGDRGADEGTAA